MYMESTPRDIGIDKVEFMKKELLNSATIEYKGNKYKHTRHPNIDSYTHGTVST